MLVGGRCQARPGERLSGACILHTIISPLRLWHRGLPDQLDFEGLKGGDGPIAGASNSFGQASEQPP